MGTIEGKQTNTGDKIMMELTIEERVQRSRDLIAQLKEAMQMWSDETDTKKRDDYWAGAEALSDYVDDNEEQLNAMIAKRSNRRTKNTLSLAKEIAHKPDTSIDLVADLLDCIG